MAESRFEIYPAPKRYPRRHTGIADSRDFTEYHWRFRAATGRVIATSAEGYPTDEIAEREIGIFLESLDAFDWSGDVVRPPVLRLADNNLGLVTPHG